MATINFDISSLFRQAFGVGRGIPFDPGQVQEPEIRHELDFPDSPIVGDATETEFVQVRSSLNASLPDGRQIFMPMQLGGVLLPNEPSIAVSSRKNIVETALAGSTRRGTVKELISIEDWQITIRGIAINFESKLIYPEDQVKSLRDLYERNEALEVKCALTNLLGIYRLVITGFELPEMIGIQHAQAYQFTCVSDEDFLLEL